MRDLSMHVLDIAQNSIRADAKLVSLVFRVKDGRWLTFTAKDDGCGMSPELLKSVTDPFTTTRTTRKVGLGVPMLKQSAECCGGSFDITSEPGVGTVTSATFDLQHIDCIPRGELCDSLLTLIVLNPEKPDFVYLANDDATGREASLDTRELRAVLGEVPLNAPDVIEWLKESIDEEFKPILEV